MTTRSNKVFQFLRGAIRGAFGEESFRGKTVLIAGMSSDGRSLLNRLCMDGVSIKFLDSSLANYYKSFAVCRDISFYEEGECVDIIVDFMESQVHVKEKTFSMSDIGNDPYTQGIHEFYM